MWQPGQVPRFDRGITHPGVANDRIREKGTCDNTTWVNNLSPQNVSIVMPPYNVPTAETTYTKVCIVLQGTYILLSVCGLLP